MSVPQRLWRFPPARERLAARFNLPNTEDMQDWEWQVADFSRIDEFLVAYQGSELSDDEKFTLMETIIQSFAESEFAESDEVKKPSARWKMVLEWLDSNIELHIYTVWYWAVLEHDLEDGWNVAPAMRAILSAHRQRFGVPDF